ncbi:MAG: hypothetical protein PHH02_05190 [Dehalococcoidales bacterium]|nr:hypothetical protein [Dehalococcoidales bacterium]MDD4323196.1 hypothetical protein [Dehalococcoidales bacterium]
MIRPITAPKTHSRSANLLLVLNQMESEPKQRGAPPGNQNARKHGFYARYLTPEERVEMERAVMAEGLDEEIALMRVKIQGILQHDPQNIELLGKGMATLASLVRTRYNLHKNDKQGLKEAVSTVLRDVALPLGISLGNFIGK